MSPAQKRMRKKVKTPLDMERFVSEVETLHNLRNQQKQIADDVSTTQKSVLEQMRDAGESRVSVITKRGERLNATVVQPEPLVIDEAALKKKVGLPLWKKMTSVVFDRKKLEGLMASGEVSAETLAEVSTITKGTPHVRVTS